MLSKEYFANSLYEIPTPFHYVARARAKLIDNGFQEIKETTPISERPDKFFYVRDSRCLCAVKMGDMKSGLVLAAHNDSPCLKAKPNSKKITTQAQQFTQARVATYGGISASTWIDRDLRIAGRAYVKSNAQEDDNDSNSQYEERLFSTDFPVAHIPSAGLNAVSQNSLAPKFNKETSFDPILLDNLDTIIAKAFQVELSQIQSTELFFMDYQKPSYLGPDESLLCSQRLDDLTSAILCLDAFLNGNSKYTTILTIFDNEEIGSRTISGARSNFLSNLFKLISPDDESFIKRCIFLSCDNNHGFHPNYPESTPPNAPKLGDGPLLSYDPILMYSSEMFTLSKVKDIAAIANIPINMYSDKNTSRTGSTFGPIVSTQLGIPSIDMGIPVLGMHSIRETCSFDDVQNMYKLLLEIVNNIGDYC